MVETARERLRHLGHSHVRFIEADFCELDPDVGVFDAVVGRLVLMYQKDPVDALRRVARLLGPGGLMVLQEYDSTMPPVSLVPLPLHQRVRSWIWDTLERSGVDVHMGFKLYAVLTEAGFPSPEVLAEGIVQTPATRYPSVPLVRVLLPRMVEYGIATAAEVDIETLEHRLIEERQRADGVYIGQMVIGAWAQRGVAST